MTRRTKGEQKAYLDGYEMCADCIEKYLSDEGKQKLNCLLMAVRNAVEALPPVTPQPKMGYWIPVTNGRGGHECSLCHEYAPSYQSGDEWLTKYCPTVEQRCRRWKNDNTRDY